MSSRGGGSVACRAPKCVLMVRAVPLLRALILLRAVLPSTRPVAPCPSMAAVRPVSPVPGAPLSAVRAVPTAVRAEGLGEAMPTRPVPTGVTPLVIPFGEFIREVPLVEGEVTTVCKGVRSQCEEFSTNWYFKV